MKEPLDVAPAGPVATLTLNRPAKRNALDEALVREIIRALADLEQNPELRLIVLRGAGADFCAGADLAQTARHAAERDSVGNLADATQLGSLFIALRRLALPVIAVVRGRALAGGAGLALACDLVVAEENAELGYPEVQLGLVPAMVGAILRRNLGEKRAFELLALGGRIGAVEAHRIGLINRVFPVLTFEADVPAFVAELARHPRSALTLIKRLLYGVDGLAFEEAIGRGAEINIMARLSAESRELVEAFLTRRR